MKQKLDRTLGMFSAITISIGTMIGSAIFVLAGTSYDAAGPSASLAIFLAGIAALFTGFSFAELVTIIPKAGGGYAYVREATGNGPLSFICGWGFWLGYAMSCGLFALGFGNFLNYFIPAIPPMLGAYALTLYVTYTNIKGVESSGKLQNIITSGLVLLLLAYMIYGAVNVDVSLQAPYFPKGLGGTFSAMGFLYMTYIGYGLITTASEEVIDPTRTIPRAIMISLVAVIFIKTAVFFVGSGIIGWESLTPSSTSTPLTDTAIVIGGRVGGYLFAFAGILATLSSINTAVMASSRTSFALSRDQRFPSIFKVINTTTKTPIFSIVVTGLIVAAAVSMRSLEHISTVTSIFSLTGYSLVNYALIVFRRKHPQLERSFKAPLYPLTPVLGIALNIFLVVQLAMASHEALAISLVIIAAGAAYYYLAMPRLHKAPKGLSPLEIPAMRIGAQKGEQEQRRIYVPVENTAAMDCFLKFSARIASAESNTKVIPLHVANVPQSIPLDSSYSELRQTIHHCDAVYAKLSEYETRNAPLVESLIVFSRDIAHGILSSLEGGKSSLVLLGWHHSGLVQNMYGGIVTQVLERATTDVCILKDCAGTDIKSILFPYGGGKYSQLTASIVKRVADAFGARITLLRVVEEIEDEQALRNQIKSAAKELGDDIEIRIAQGELTDEIVRLSPGYDLLVIGASLDWGIKEYITGLRSDEITQRAECPVLIVKNYHAALQRSGIRRYMHRIKEKLHQI